MRPWYRILITLYDLLRQCFEEYKSFIVNTGTIFILFKNTFITKYHLINYILNSKTNFNFLFISSITVIFLSSALSLNWAFTKQKVIICQPISCTQKSLYLWINPNFLHSTLKMMLLNVQIITITQILLSSKILKTCAKLFTVVHKFESVCISNEACLKFYKFNHIIFQIACLLIILKQLLLSSIIQF